MNRIRIEFYTEGGTAPINKVVVESRDFNQVELAELAAEHILHGFKNSNGSRAHLQFDAGFPAPLQVEATDWT